MDSVNLSNKGDKFFKALPISSPSHLPPSVMVSRPLRKYLLLVYKSANRADIIAAVAAISAKTPRTVPPDIPNVLNKPFKPEVPPAPNAPPVNNDEQLADRVYKILKDSFEPGVVKNNFTPEMGCEEFSLFQQEVPGLFLFIGNDKEGRDVIPIHAPNYVFNDEILVNGIKALCEIVLGYNKKMTAN
jgi:metal-dependent amidase/aminoacylase/carboxypeptidase family protein